MTEYTGERTPMTIVFESADEIDAMALEEALTAADIPYATAHDLEAIFGKGREATRLYVEPRYVERASAIISALHADVASGGLAVGDEIVGSSGDRDKSDLQQRREAQGSGTGQRRFLPPMAALCTGGILLLVERLGFVDSIMTGIGARDYYRAVVLLAALGVYVILRRLPPPSA